MFRGVPVSRLSTQITSCPSLRKRSQRCDPMKPAPPVMTVLKMSPPNIWIEAVAGWNDELAIVPTIQPGLVAWQSQAGVPWPIEPLGLDNCGGAAAPTGFRAQLCLAHPDS